LNDRQLPVLGLMLGDFTGIGPEQCARVLSDRRLSDAAQNSAWGASPDQQAWQGLAKASDAANGDGYKGRLTEYLARMMCRSRFASGAVAAGVARRAMATSFQGASRGETLAVG
jgi:hypothetical protein